MTAKLTIKQEKFCQAYVETGNASEAARMAGIELKDVPPKDGKYVYFILCPEREQILYVGKGTKDRMRHHLRDVRLGHISGLKKYKTLKAFVDGGHEPVPVCVAEAGSDYEALKLERAFIFGIGIERLSNGISGARHPDEIALQKLEDVMQRTFTLAEWKQIKPRSQKEIDFYIRWVHEVAKVRDWLLDRISKLELAGNGATR